MNGLAPDPVVDTSGVLRAGLGSLALLHALPVGMVGAFLGPADTVGVVLLTFLFGALLTIAVPATAGLLARLAHNVRLEGSEGGDSKMASAPPRVSYVMAIGLATAGWLLFKG